MTIISFGFRRGIYCWLLDGVQKIDLADNCTFHFDEILISHVTTLLILYFCIF